MPAASGKRTVWKSRQKVCWRQHALPQRRVSDGQYNGAGLDVSALSGCSLGLWFCVFGRRVARPPCSCTVSLVPEHSDRGIAMEEDVKDKHFYVRIRDGFFRCFDVDMFQVFASLFKIGRGSRKVLKWTEFVKVGRQSAQVGMRLTEYYVGSHCVGILSPARIRRWVTAVVQPRPWRCKRIL